MIVSDLWLRLITEYRHGLCATFYILVYFSYKNLWKTGFLFYIVKIWRADMLKTIVWQLFKVWVENEKNPSHSMSKRINKFTKQLCGLFISNMHLVVSKLNYYCINIARYTFRMWCSERTLNSFQIADMVAVVPNFQR